MSEIDDRRKIGEESENDDTGKINGADGEGTSEGASADAGDIDKKAVETDMGEKTGEAGENENAGKQSLKSEILDWLLHIAIAVVAGLFIVAFVAQITIVHDISMEPTLTEGDRLLVEKVGYRFGWLKRGDIIVFKSPMDDRLLIKRIVALEGDRVEIRDGKVYVNGELSLIGLPEEPETPQGDLHGYTNLTVPEGMIYILGDNRPYSIDSTEFGPIEEEWIKGRAIFRFYPFNRIGAFG